MEQRKYLLLSMDDVRALLPLLDHVDGQHPAYQVVDRLRRDTGGDFISIAQKLKRVRACPACIVEGQEQSCNYWPINKQGRRLMRLIERADHVRSPGNHTDK